MFRPHKVSEAQLNGLIIIYYSIIELCDRNFETQSILNRQVFGKLHIYVLHTMIKSIN